MKNKNKTNKLLAVFIFCAVIMTADTSFAVTKSMFLPKVFDALGYTLPASRFSSNDETDISAGFAARLALEAMGWDFVITAYERLTLLPEWSDKNPVYEIASRMKPPLPKKLLDTFDTPISESDIPLLRDWLLMCKKSATWKCAFAWEGTELVLIKHGIGNPKGSPNGDIKKGVNEPLFIAALAVDTKRVPCQIATAVMVGANKAPLATIAGENYGVIGGINGGYFAGAKPIGVLKRQGYLDNAKFWPYRSAFGWNEKGDTVFIDGKEIADIAKEKKFDFYTEMLQAGPLLLKNGALSENTEKIRENVLENRHPRTIVGSDGKRTIWAVVDGRDNMHSVGATIEETRKICLWLNMKDALNLDGGGSSSLWWRGMTVSLPSNSKDTERPIPYAVLMFQEGSGVRQ